MLNGCLLPFGDGDSESEGGSTTQPPGGMGACVYKHSTGSYCAFSPGSVSDVDDSWGCSPASSLEACWAMTDDYSDYSGGCAFVSTYSDVEYLEGKTCQELEESRSGGSTTPTATPTTPVAVTPAATTPVTPW